MPEMRQSPRTNTEEIVRKFNEADAIMSAETSSGSSSSSDRKVEVVDIRYEELSSDNLRVAQELVEKVFALEKGVAAADLEHQVHKQGTEAEREIPEGSGEAYNEQHWIARDKAGKLLGITGRYDVAGDKPEHFWLGWFALAPELRGSGLGAALFDKVSSEGRSDGKTVLYIISSDHSDMAGNAKFYHRNSCPIVAVLNKSGSHVSKETDLSDEIIKELRQEYGSFIRDGVNIFVRKKDIKFSSE